MLLKPPRNFKHLMHLRFYVYITRICFTFLCSVHFILFETILKAFFCTGMCVTFLCFFYSCFVLRGFFLLSLLNSFYWCNDLGKMLIQERNTAYTRSPSFYCVSVWVRSAFGHYHLSSAK